MGNQQDWTQPLPLDDAGQALPFPLQCLPPTVSAYVEAVSQSTATAVDMAAVAALAVAAGTVQGKYSVRAKADYYEPLNLYCLIIAKPAERKSSVMRAMTEFVYEYEREENAKRAAIIDRQLTLKNIKEAEITKAEKAKNADEAISLKHELRELEKNAVKPLRLVADDTTPEALTSLLAENDGKISIISAEGGLFETLAGRYSSSNAISIDTVLKAHCGDPIRVDRKGRPSEYIPHPKLTMLLSVQENVLDGLVSNSVFRGRGLTARFMYSQPNSTVGNRSLVTPPIPDNARNNYKKLMTSLLEIPLPKQDEKPHSLALSVEAFELINKFFDYLEPQLVGELEHMADWSGKLIGATIRIAGILYLMEFVPNMPFIPEIPEATMKNAIKISMYFLDHAKRAYQLMGADEQTQAAKFVLKKLSKQTERELKRHAIYRMCRSSAIKKVDDIDPPITLLIEYGYLQELPQPEREGAGRKGDTVYLLNPLFFK